MASQRDKGPALTRPVVMTFLVLAIVGALWAAAEVFKPLALSVLLSFALAPAVGWFERRGLPRMASVLLVTALAVGAVGGVGYVVGRQVVMLADELPNYRGNIVAKLRAITPREATPIEKATEVADEVAKALDESNEPPPVTDVNIVEDNSFRARVTGAVGPYMEYLGVGSFVFIIVIFTLHGREDLRDRIIQLFGRGRISLTTKTMDDISQRISRYIATFAAMNAAFGVIVGVGLWAIGVPYAVLFGCLAALLRFIPYVGPAVAFMLPMIFSLAHFDGWTRPLAVAGLFAVLEAVLNSAIEPLLYGKTTGTSALGLLVAATFWTWLWGIVGLFLSTPLTVCLAVLGKYVPGLRPFAILLGEDPEISPDVLFYQRLVARDADGAEEVVEESLTTRPRAEVFDAVLVPALYRAERDVAEGSIDEDDRAFAWRVVSRLLDDLEGTPDIVAEAAEKADGPRCLTFEGPQPRMIGVASDDNADAIILEMLSQLLRLASPKLSLEVCKDAPTPLALAERLKEDEPDLLVLSHLPPQGLTEARYQIKRLRSTFENLPILVGRWGNSANATKSVERLTEAGASNVARNLTEARDQIVSRFGTLSSPDDHPGTAAPKPVETEA